MDPCSFSKLSQRLGFLFEDEFEHSLKHTHKMKMVDSFRKPIQSSDSEFITSRFCTQVDVYSWIHCRYSILHAPPKTDMKLEHDRFPKDLRISRIPFFFGSGCELGNWAWKSTFPFPK